MPLFDVSIIDPWFDVTERAKVRIRSADLGGVTGLMPEVFSFGFSNEFAQPFAQIMSSFNTGLVAGQELTAKGGKVDFTATLQELKDQVWKGGSSISFDLTLLYVARRTALADVVAPVKKLIQLSAGSTAVRGQLEAAERTVSATVVKPPPVVQVEVGYVIRLKKAVIEGLRVEVTNVSDITGMPSEARVSFNVKSKKMFLADDTEVDIMGGISVPSIFGVRL